MQFFAIKILNLKKLQVIATICRQSRQVLGLIKHKNISLDCLNELTENQYFSGSELLEGKPFDSRKRFLSTRSDRSFVTSSSLKHAAAKCNTFYNYLQGTNSLLEKALD